MKYNELKNGDYFKIVRENNNKIYQKQDFYFVEIGTRNAFRRLNGGTIVEKVNND
jgi:hypothetical protein